MLQVSAQVPELCVLFHESVQALSRHFLAKERRHVYITPTSYLELIHSYKNLLTKKQNEVLHLALPLLRAVVHLSSKTLHVVLLCRNVLVSIAWPKLSIINRRQPVLLCLCSNTRYTLEPAQESLTRKQISL